MQYSTTISYSSYYFPICQLLISILTLQSKFSQDSQISAYTVLTSVNTGNFFFLINFTHPISFLFLMDWTWFTSWFFSNWLNVIKEYDDKGHHFLILILLGMPIMFHIKHDTILGWNKYISTRKTVIIYCYFSSVIEI